MTLSSLALSVLLVGAAGDDPSPRPPSPGRRAVPCENRYHSEIREASASVSTVWTVPVALIKAVIWQESAFDPRAVSRAGAVGLMQVLPRNAQLLGVTPYDLWEPATNILAGARLLAILLRHYRGDVVSALVAYNARPRRLFAPLPENGETAPYVRAVLRCWRSFEKCAGGRAVSGLSGSPKPEPECSLRFALDGLPRG
jgi:soluble lytic murein transglycosylase-like protein